MSKVSKGAQMTASKGLKQEGPSLELELLGVGSLLLIALEGEGKIKVQYCPFNSLIMPFYLERDQAAALIQGLRILSGSVWGEEKESDYA